LIRISKVTLAKTQDKTQLALAPLDNKIERSMLLLPQSIYDARARLWSDFEAGKTTAEQAYQKMLELDPDDHIGMLGLGRLRMEAGDLEGAKEYFWRAIRAHPCTCSPYLQLSQMLFEEPESVALAEGLGELGLGKRVDDSEALLKGVDFQKAGLTGKTLEDFRKLPGSTQTRLIVLAMRAKRDREPESTAAQLRPLRLIEQMQEEADLDVETVNAIIGEGEAIVPLLVGVLREWAQNLLGDDGDAALENALALLGETGSPSEIPHLLEFVDLKHETAAGTASWAVGRIIERHPEESAQLLRSIASGLGPAERLAVAEQILRHPEVDPAGSLFEQLSENLESMKMEDRTAFFPLLLGAMAVTRGREGVNLGHKVLLRQAGYLSRNVRRECDDLLAAFIQDGVPPVSREPSRVTVYEICSREVDWDTKEEEEMEVPPMPEPVRRKTSPGRNEPCWCGSGKKYKKCHLDSDKSRDELPRRQGATDSRETNEFAGLRKRIGDFLGEVLPEREFKLAIEELFGDRMQDKAEDATIGVVDWILHDRIAARLGRTVMQEFLVRHGSRITKREREMVEAWSRSFVGLYEVQELTAGVGLKLKDLIFGETFFAHDVSMSTKLARWDGLLARVLPGERGTELGGIGLTVPRHNIEPLREWMEEDRREAGLEWREYLKLNWPRIRRQSFDISANWMESLRLSNADGEEILFSKAVHRIIDEPAAIGALEGCPEFSRGDAREHFVWLDDKKTVLGNIRMVRNELVLECNSKERVKRGKLLLLGLAGESLRHVRDEFTTQKELKRRAAEEPRDTHSGEEEIPKEILDEAMARFMEDHYRGWPDTKLPALDGKTPREAVRTPKGRRLVIEILKDFENVEDRKRQASEPFYDVDRLRAELGLEH